MHIQALTEDEYSKVRSLGDPVGCAKKLEDMWRQVKRGDYTNDVFGTLWQQYGQQFPQSDSKPPFLGYWLNLIPSRASIFKSNCNSQSHLYLVQQIAASLYDMALETDDEITWMLPHHAIYVSGIKFRLSVPDNTQVELFASQDGNTWNLLFNSGSSSEAVTKADATIDCRSKGWAKSFKLCVRKGNYSNVLRIGGILQVM